MILYYTLDMTNRARSPGKPEKRFSCSLVHEAGSRLCRHPAYITRTRRGRSHVRTPEGAVPYLFIRNFLYRVLKIRR